MDSEVTDRRAHARFEPPARADARATLRPGCEVTLVDVSAAGALVDARRPLRPGARVHLQVSTASRRFAIDAHVLRCAVAALDPIAGITYRGALTFEHRIEWGWVGSTGCAQSMIEHERPIVEPVGKRLPQNRVTHTLAVGDERNVG